MSYIGHTSEDGRKQPLKDHLQGTGSLCAGFAAVFGLEAVGRILGLYHDIGKYSPAFQKRILENGPRVDHSTAGAKELRSAKFAPYLFCIAGHHSGLMNLGGRFSENDGTLFARLKKNLTGNLDYSAFKNEITVQPSIPEDLLNKLSKKDFYEQMFLTRMLFSCLVDADYLDTEQFMTPGAVRGRFDTLSALWQKFQQHIKGFYPPRNEFNKKRCAILEECLAAAQGEQGLYSLTVPTGGGKTLASLGFALEYALKYNKKRIIYVIPYTSIIEQTASVFRDVVGVQNVIEHHMHVDYNGDKYKENALVERHKLAAENWDAPIIVTTNVQFFESLYSCQTSRCRKLHNIADSVIIFDEAQMLPNDYLQPYTRAIQNLVKDYRVTAVLCTATQPSLNKFFPADMPCQEICSDVEGLYEFFRRVTFKRQDFTDFDDLLDALNRQEQVLCIVNSKKDAQLIFDKMQGEGCFHLSTFMCPQHRREILAEVKRRLKNKLPCKLVATSLVEAGVDVDFPVVYREMAGLDSIIQAAGRCNRENKNSAEASIVWVFTVPKENRRLPSYIKLPCEVSKMIFAKHQDIASVAAIKEYFDILHQFKGDSLDKKGILTNSNNEMPFADIDRDFVLIDEDGRNVFLPIDEKSEEILETLRKGIRSRDLLRQAGQYMVNVYEYQYEKLLELGQVEMLDESISVLLDMHAYDKNKGLIVNTEEGVGLFD